MKNKNKKNYQISIKASLVVVIVFLVGVVGALANNQTQLSQTVSDGTKSVDIVDAGGTPVVSPAVSFSAATFSFATQDTTGTLGTASQVLRAYNPTVAQVLTVSLAGSAPGALWTSGGNTYDFNDTSGYTDGVDTDTKGGQMTVNPAAGTLAGVSGCATTNVAKGVSSSFVETSANSIDLITSTSNATNQYCRWDLTGVGLTQKLPAAQASGTYALTMVLTIT